MNQSKQNNLVNIGTIVNTHALRGEVRIFTDSIVEERFYKGAKLYYYQLDQLKELEVETSRIHKNFVLVKFKNLNSINDVEFLKGTKIYGEYIELDDQEFYYNEVVDFEVYENNILIGKVFDFLNQNAYDSFLIKTVSGKNINIPVLDEIIENVDKKNKRIDVNYLDNQYEED